MCAFERHPIRSRHGKVVSPCRADAIQVAVGPNLRKLLCHKQMAVESDLSGHFCMAGSGPIWKSWYKTARWRALRQQRLLIDNYTCQRTGRLCGGKYPAPDSPVVNHKAPHRGSELLFWDINNLETVTKEVHDSQIQKEEQASLGERGVWY